MRQVIPFCKEIVFKTNIASITSVSLEHEEKVFDGEVSGDFIVFGDYKIHNDTTEKELFKYRLPFTAIIPDEVDKETVKVDIDNFTYEQIEDDVVKVNIDFSIEGELVHLEEVVDEDDVVRDDVTDEELDREIDELLGIDEKDDEVKEGCEDLDNSNGEVEVLETESEQNCDCILDNNEEVCDSLDDVRDVIPFSEEIEVLDNQLIDDAMEAEMMGPEMNDESMSMEIVKQEEVTKEVDEYVTYHVHIVKENETLENIIKTYNISIDYVKEYNDITELKIGDKLIIPEYGEE